MNDEQLHRLLRDAPAEVPLPRGFAREVWARIEAADAETGWALVRRVAEAVLAWLGRPVPALVTIASCVALGAAGGLLAGGSKHAEPPPGELAYARSIDPLGHQHHEHDEL